MALADNWFAAGSAILAQIQAQCPAFARVAYAPSLDLIAKLLPGVAPAAFVVPGPVQVQQPPKQTWYVAMLARNVESVAEGGALMNEAGALVSAVMAALANFVPGPEFGPLFFPLEDHRYPDVGQGVYILTYAVLIEPEFWPYY